MKNYILYILIFIPLLNYAQNDIDSISTKDELNKFIWKNFPNKKKEFLQQKAEEEELLKYFPEALKQSPFDSVCSSLYMSLSSKGFKKIDLDQNGLLDLLVFDYPKWVEEPKPYLILSFEKDKYQLVQIPNKGLEIENCYYPIIKKIEGKTLLLKLNLFGIEKGKPISKDIDTLTYERGYWSEHGKKSKYRINSISLEKDYIHTTPPSSEHPILTKIIIDSSLKITFKEKYLTWKKGAFYGHIGNISDTVIIKTCKISRHDFEKISNFLNRINFISLKDLYSYPISHATFSTLNINFNQNNTKTIKDYAMWGSYGLISLYKILDEILENSDCLEKN